MLAYYINLINQQEKEEQKEQQPIERKSVSSKKVEETNDSKIEEESTTKERHASPKKPAKWLAREEAERIIATILEKRPGRAEFSVPQMLEKKKKERKSEEQRNTVLDEKKSQQHNSDVVVAEEKAESHPALVVEAVAAPPRKRGRPRKTDPFKVVDQALGSNKEIPDAPIEVESKPRVSDDVLSMIISEGKINLEAGGKPDNSLSSVKTTLEEIEKEAPKIAFGTISSSGRGKKNKSKSMSVETKLGETVTLGAVPDTKESSFTLDVEELGRRQSKWWRKPVALEIVPYEVELVKSLHELRSVYEAQLMSHSVYDGQHNRPSLASRMLVVFPFR